MIPEINYRYIILDSLTPLGKFNYFNYEFEAPQFSYFNHQTVQKNIFHNEPQPTTNMEDFWHTLPHSILYADFALQYAATRMIKHNHSFSMDHVWSKKKNTVCEAKRLFLFSQIFIGIESQSYVLRKNYYLYKSIHLRSLVSAFLDLLHYREEVQSKSLQKQNSPAKKRFNKELVTTVRKASKFTDYRQSS